MEEKKKQKSTRLNKESDRVKKTESKRKMREKDENISREKDEDISGEIRSALTF